MVLHFFPKKIGELTTKKPCQIGQEGNIGITLLPFPLGNGLGRYPQPTAKRFLGKPVLPPVIPNQLGNGNTGHASDQSPRV